MDRGQDQVYYINVADSLITVLFQVIAVNLMNLFYPVLLPLLLC